jgi:hypothetical protein
MSFGSAIHAIPTSSADFAELVADRYLSLLEEPAHAG